MTNKTYDIHAHNYSELEAIQQLDDVVTKVAIEENERITQGIYVEGCEQFTINVGGTQIAFPLNAAECCALDAFIATLLKESGLTLI